MAIYDIATQLVRLTKQQIFNKGLQIAAALHLPVESWAPGDPTRTDFWFIAEILEDLEKVRDEFVRSAFLDFAEDEMLAIKAEQDFDVVAEQATYATCTIRLTNQGGGVWPLPAGSLTVKSSTTDKTYHTTTGGTLASGVGQTLDLEVVADEPGSDSSAAVGEIDELVTVLLSVDVTNTTAAVGLDKQSDDSIRQQCRDKMGSLSGQGPAEIFNYVCKSSALTGTTGITDARTYSDSDTGDVLVYVRGPSGAVSSDDRDAAEEACAKHAVAQCQTLTLASVTNVTVPVTYQLWVYEADARTDDELEEAVEEALEQMAARRPIGGDVKPPATTGSLWKKHVEKTIEDVSEYAFDVSVSLPAGDTALTNGQVAVIGTVTGTITRVPNP